MVDLALVKPDTEAPRTIDRAALESARADYARQQAEWRVTATEAQRRIDATDGAMQAIEALLRALDAPQE